MKLCKCGDIKEENNIEVCNKCAMVIFKEWWKELSDEDISGEKDKIYFKALHGFMRYLGLIGSEKAIK